MEKKLGRQIDMDADEYLQTTTSIEPMQLEEEFVRLPADMAYWNERYAEAFRKFLRAKIDRERVSARLHMEQRAMQGAASVVGGKKAPTVADLEAAVEVHDDMVAACDAEIEAEVAKVRINGVLEAIRAKKDMLIQLGVRQRIELENDPMVREESRTRRMGKGGLR